MISFDVLSMFSLFRKRKVMSSTYYNFQKENGVPSVLVLVPFPRLDSTCGSRLLSFCASKDRGFQSPIFWSSVVETAWIIKMNRIGPRLSPYFTPQVLSKALFFPATSM
jgi:hypothetical protein